MLDRTLNMDYFNYKNGQLFAENIEVAKITNEAGTPLYIYSKATFLDHLQKIQTAYDELDTTIQSRPVETSTF